MLKRHHQLVLMLLRVGDVVTMLAAWVLAYLARHVSYYAGVSTVHRPSFGDGSKGICKRSGVGLFTGG